MSCFQATTCKPYNGFIVNRPIAGLGSTSQYPLHSNALGVHKLQQKAYPRLVLIAASHKRHAPVCASSGNGNSGTSDDVSSLAAPFMLDITYHAKVLHDNVVTEVYCPLLKHKKKLVMTRPCPRLVFWLD
jgi:hypothetical protein